MKESGAPPNRNRGSSDIGNVSQVVPTLQPNVPIVAGARVEIHTRRFAEATLSASGIEGMMEGIRALALTGYELFTDPSLVKDAWRARKRRETAKPQNRKTGTLMSSAAESGTLMHAGFHLCPCSAAELIYVPVLRSSTSRFCGFAALLP